MEFFLLVHIFQFITTTVYFEKILIGMQCACIHRMFTSKHKCVHHNQFAIVRCIVRCAFGLWNSRNLI